MKMCTFNEMATCITPWNLFRWSGVQCMLLTQSTDLEKKESHDTVLIFIRRTSIEPKQKLLTILIFNSHPILMQFSCNNRWDFQKCPCNSHLQFSSNSHQTILIQFSPTILIQFSPTILIQFSPDNSHPIFTWQFSSNFHLTILIQFSPTILINTAQSILTNNAQPIFS